MTTAKIHSKQLQQYTQDNYNNTPKTTTTIHARLLQKYTQDNYNTLKTNTTIHTANQQKLGEYCAPDGHLQSVITPDAV